MEVDKTMVILAVFLLVVLGIFAFSQMGSADVGVGAVKASGYASQFGGGGCGR